MTEKYGVTFEWRESPFHGYYRIATGLRCCSTTHHGWVCTLASDHDGPHEAWSGSSLGHTWPKETTNMKVIKHLPPPVPQPPATYDITGLSQEEAQYLMFVCQKSSYLANHLDTTFKGQIEEPWKLSSILNVLCHELLKAGVP